MALVLVEILGDFIHGSLRARRGQRDVPMPEHLAAQLERKRLVRIQPEETFNPAAPAPPPAAELVAAKVGADEGKAAAAGVGVLSSSSPAAPRSRKATLKLSDGGAAPRKRPRGADA